ncbi:MAG TPA: hypothetical protein VF286_00965 [Acidiphilium sp.]
MSTGAALSTLTTFIPAAGETVTITAPGTGGVFPMPVVDSGNTALSITNPGPEEIRLNFGTSADLPVNFNALGLFPVLPGTTVLLDGPLASVAGIATYVSVAPVGSSMATVTLQRGSVGTLQVAGLGTVQ